MRTRRNVLQNMSIAILASTSDSDAAISDKLDVPELSELLKRALEKRTGESWIRLEDSDGEYILFKRRV